MKPRSARPPWTVVDLFSGAGGMSYGFHAHPSFKIIGAVDAEKGKPSSGIGALECNKTYEANIGLKPLEADIGNLTVESLREYLIAQSGADKVDVLISCAPCTGFSRTIRKNLIQDDPRNSLVTGSAKFVEALKPEIFLMENVGELLHGKFKHHFQSLSDSLSALGYVVQAEVHALEEFGLPQLRRRALVIASKKPLTPRSLQDLWRGYSISSNATTVRRAIGHLPPVEGGQRHPADRWHVSPSATGTTLERLQMIPQDGGSWPDLLKKPGGKDLLIPSMLRYVSQGRVGPHPDVYGRMAWDRPSVTIKRECSHTGNGRYAHPEQHRLCTVREIGLIQGFPSTYQFRAGSLSNMYRHIGDAVPPLVSYQLAWVSDWILSGVRPAIANAVLPGTHLRPSDIVATAQPDLFEAEGALAA